MSAAAMVVMHLAIWRWIAFRRHQPFGNLLTYWDAAYYTAIARDGYSGSLFAFYPAYPLTVGTLAKLLGVTEIFHSHHTEALFLLLSFLSFFFSGTRRPVWGGLFGAICALTRNQGVFVVATTTLLAAWVETTSTRRVRAFFITGFVSLLGVLAFLTFQTIAAGSPFAFIEAQKKGWTHVESVGAALQTFVFGNPWQSIDPYNVLWYVTWWVFLVGAVMLARRQPALGIYAALCLSAQLFQGEFVNTFRFAAPVFPLFFLLGDGCARRPRWFQFSAVLLLFLLNVSTARYYGLGEWAY